MAIIGGNPSTKFNNLKIDSQTKNTDWVFLVFWENRSEILPDTTAILELMFSVNVVTLQMLSHLKLNEEDLAEA